MSHVVGLCLPWICGRHLADARQTTLGVLCASTLAQGVLEAIRRACSSSVGLVQVEWPNPTPLSRSLSLSLYVSVSLFLSPSLYRSICVRSPSFPCLYLVCAFVFYILLFLSCPHSLTPSHSLSCAQACMHTHPHTLFVLSFLFQLFFSLLHSSSSCLCAHSEIFKLQF